MQHEITGQKIKVYIQYALYIIMIIYHKKNKKITKKLLTRDFKFDILLIVFTKRRKCQKTFLKNVEKSVDTKLII